LTDENTVGVGEKTFKSIFSRGNSFVVGGSQENAGESDELLDLCSGRFTGILTKSSYSTAPHGGLYSEDGSNTQGDTLLNVLSGIFGNVATRSENGNEEIQCKRYF